MVIALFPIISVIINPIIRPIINPRNPYGGTQYKNIISNGNFANGTTGWSVSASGISVVSNVLSNTGIGSSTEAIAQTTTTTPAIVGDKIYIKGRARVTNADATSIRARIVGSTGGTVQYALNQANPVQNQWYSFSTVLTNPANATGFIKVQVMHTYADNATQNGKVMEVMEVMAFELTTEFGAGNEPDAARCETNIAPFIIW
jgi:hypothetical protein